MSNASVLSTYFEALSVKPSTKTLVNKKVFTVTAQLTKPSQAINVYISSVLHFMVRSRVVLTTFVGHVCWSDCDSNAQTSNRAIEVSDGRYSAFDVHRVSTTPTKAKFLMLLGIGSAGTRGCTRVLGREY